jgi:hypothetical protein
MTYAEIKDLVMHQINYDSDDVDEYEPYIGAYINEGYNELVYAYAGVYVTNASTTYPTLVNGEDEPATPEWTHKALADWATWMVYRNGSPAKQNRGYLYKQSFDQMVGRVRAAGGSTGIAAKITVFSNVPD